MIAALAITFVLLPILVTTLYVSRVRRTIRRPGLLALWGIVEGYLVVAAVLYWALLLLISIGVSGQSAGGSPAEGSPDIYFRPIAGIPIAALLHLFVLWCTHRGMAKA